MLSPRNQNLVILGFTSFTAGALVSCAPIIFAVIASAIGSDLQQRTGHQNYDTSEVVAQTAAGSLFSFLAVGASAGHAIYRAIDLNGGSVYPSHRMAQVLPDNIRSLFHPDYNYKITAGVLAASMVFSFATAYLGHFLVSEDTLQSDSTGEHAAASTALGSLILLMVISAVGVAAACCKTYREEGSCCPDSADVDLEALEAETQVGGLSTL